MRRAARSAGRSAARRRVFAAPTRLFARVLVAGRWRALYDEGIAARFDAAMQTLWLPGGTLASPG